MNVLEDYTLPEGRSLGLKVVHKDGRPEYPHAPEDFRWNLEPGGETEAPDWDPEPVCGVGLHVWEWAQGKLHASSIWHLRPDDVIWLAVEYDTEDAVDLGGKIKVPRCRTIAVSFDRKEVVSFIKLHTPVEKQGLFFFEEKTVEKGDATVGDCGRAVAGARGTASAGNFGTAIAGEGGTARAGNNGIAKAGDGGTASAGDNGSAETGNDGTAIAGNWGAAVAGIRGRAQAGYEGFAKVGTLGCATVGFEGVASAGVGGMLRFGMECSGTKEFLVGQDGVEPDTAYMIIENGGLVPVDTITCK